VTFSANFIGYRITQNDILGNNEAGKQKSTLKTEYGYKVIPELLPCFEDTPYKPTCGLAHGLNDGLIHKR
jgi:hypothetical protein